ncbi:hypothetical protein B484DRAFT_472505, partial [Ochromonadaceae sp. CCMP2298]
LLLNVLHALAAAHQPPPPYCLLLPTHRLTGSQGGQGGVTAVVRATCTAPARALPVPREALHAVAYLPQPRHVRLTRPLGSPLLLLYATQLRQASLLRSGGPLLLLAATELCTPPLDLCHLRLVPGLHGGPLLLLQATDLRQPSLLRSHRVAHTRQHDVHLRLQHAHGPHLAQPTLIQQRL